MELRQLKYFLTVADARSFVSAANSLFLSRQAISKAISQLESEFGVELFVRDSNGAFLTPAGVMLYDRVRSSVMDLESVRDEMRRHGARYYQHIRLGFSIGTIRLYEAALLAVKAAQTNVAVQYAEYSEETCRKMLLEHQIDLAVCMEQPTDAMFSVEEIVRSPYGLLIRAQSELASENCLELSDMKWLPLAGLADAQTAALCETHNLRPTYSGFDLYRLFSLTASGQCGMLLPKILIPLDWPELLWLPINFTECWKLYRVTMRSLENNILYRTVLDELQLQVFDNPKKKEADNHG